MIHVIATIEVNPDARSQFITEFKQLVPMVHAENGCIEYGPAVDAGTDIDAQTEKGPNTVTVIEKWESVDALKAHLVAPHMGEFREKVKDLVAGTTIHILENA